MRSLVANELIASGLAFVRTSRVHSIRPRRGRQPGSILHHELGRCAGAVLWSEALTRPMARTRFGRPNQDVWIAFRTMAVLGCVGKRKGLPPSEGSADRDDCLIPQ